STIRAVSGAFLAPWDGDCACRSNPIARENPTSPESGRLRRRNWPRDPDIWSGDFLMGRELLLCVVVALPLGGGLASLSADQPIRGNTKTAETPAGLLEALHDKDPSVRLQAAQLLVQMGEG